MSNPSSSRCSEHGRRPVTFLSSWAGECLHY